MLKCSGITHWKFDLVASQFAFRSTSAVIFFLELQGKESCFSIEPAAEWIWIFRIIQRNFKKEAY
jgi:hypothetical protein